MKKQAYMAVDPGVVGAVGGLTTGYSSGRQIAESTANALSSQGYKTTNQSLARNAATILAPIGALGGMALGYKHKGKLMRLARKATSEPILHTLAEGVIPFGTGALGGMAAGAGTGALASLRGKFSNNKEDKEMKKEAFWVGFEKRAGLIDRAGQIARNVGNTVVGGTTLRNHASDALNTVQRVTGVQHLRQGTRQVGKLMNSGAISPAGQLVNPAMQSAAAAANQNLRTGVARMGGTVAATAGTAYLGHKLLGRKPQQPAQQAPAQVPAYQ